MSRTAHVVAQSNGAACLHCGRAVTFGMPIAIDDFVAMSNAFVKTHAKCKKPAGDQCAFCLGHGHTYLGCETVDTLGRWRESRDTGLSSEAIYRYFGGLGGDPRHPIDPADFGRCYRLTKRFPETLRALQALAAASKVWAALHKHWDELCRLYEEEFPTGRAPRLYARMEELGTHG
ncbi:MAG: hypothetical protein HOW73_20240 [Polyangiaceae bacterium]|nr:hypothetical protein [Polyangiaceae bacterium]